MTVTRWFMLFSVICVSTLPELSEDSASRFQLVSLSAKGAWRWCLLFLVLKIDEASIFKLFDDTVTNRFSRLQQMLRTQRQRNSGIAAAAVRCEDFLVQDKFEQHAFLTVGCLE